MSFIGESPSFDAFCDDSWKEFSEKLDIFLSLNNITENKRKIAVLISCICDDTYDIMRNLCYPNKPNEESYDYLIELMNSIYYVTATENNGATIFRKRYEFYHIKQNVNETILEWFDRVKLMAQNCRFGDRYSSIVADRFYCGLYSLDIVEKICQQHGAFKLFQLVEMALKYEKETQEQNVLNESLGNIVL